MTDQNTEFDFDSFETHWNNYSEEKKADAVQNINHLEPSLATLPVLAGITSYHFNVRNNARKSLEAIRNNLSVMLRDSNDKNEYQKGMRDSASICQRIYELIRPQMQFNDLSYFLKKLIIFEGKGAFFAFKAVYNDLISSSAMEKIILTLDDKSRLLFVEQYLKSEPSVRLKFGFSFKRILKSINDRNAVIDFFAHLFDVQGDMDPFLKNIGSELRNPNAIINKELKSDEPKTNILGLKALAMITPRISSDLLFDILATEELKNIRIIIYKIVENSTLGNYANLFYPLLELFYKCDKQEALQAFKALVVCGKVPLYTLLEMIRKNYPTLMPMINIEISRLSKISFFVIQDIALNKDKYLTVNLDANLACIFGMIKKRPERIVKILKQYDDSSKDSLRMDVTKFIEKTKLLLTQEKRSIESEFNSTITLVKADAKKSKGLIKKLFLDSSEKKMEELKQNKDSKFIDFEGESIKNVDLSSSTLLATTVYFNKCIIQSCDFSKASFSNIYFKGTVFYNVDMRKAIFNEANFDNATFINVDGQGAKFNNCSFQNVSIYNSNFNHCDLRNAPFINSIISKTSFGHTDLSCSSFTFSRVSAVSFVSANIDQADFSGVNARFCRFPASSKTIIRSDGIDYNARQYQLSFEDMPKLNNEIIKEVDMVIFCEFIHYGEAKFLKQNRLSLLTAFDIFRPKQADLFQIIPFLLHWNIDFPGLGSINPKTPHGICDYIPSIETQDALKKYIKKEDIKVLRTANYAIDGLFTIGSTGSLAQTTDSDIDYWVCINENNFSLQGLKTLREKLASLERFAMDEFNIQVTFFVVDIIKAKENDFGESTIESSGTAQTRLLKEEFYRTMIYVAGKIPLWSVLPTSISINYYNSILTKVSSTPSLARYIDLGDIHAISTSEYFGASIWQMFKWLKSPFKSVIKMALLEKYIYGYGKESLLCNQYKDEWMNSGAQLKLAQNDSYFILLNNLLRHYEDSEDNESVKILITCFFLKLGISRDSQIDNTVFGLRKILLDKCIRKWGWSKEKIYEIGSFETWQYSEIASLSSTIEKYMVKKYKTVNAGFERLSQGQSKISPEDRTVLGRKVYIEFSIQPGKVKKILLVSRSKRHFHGLHLQYLQSSNQTATWQLVNKNTKSLVNHEEALISGTTIEEIGAWLVNNGLYNETSVINLVPNPTYVTFDDIRKLYKAISDFFNPVLGEYISFDQLLLKNRIVCLFLSINFYAPKKQHQVTEYTAVYLNSWGEMFCKSYSSDIGFQSIEDAKTDIMKRIGIKKLPLNTAFYFSKGAPR